MLQGVTWGLHHEDWRKEFIISGVQSLVRILHEGSFKLICKGYDEVLYRSMHLCFILCYSTVPRSCCLLILRWRAASWSAQTKEPLTRSTDWTSTSWACSSTLNRRTGFLPTATTRRWVNSQFKRVVVCLGLLSDNNKQSGVTWQKWKMSLHG